ncbi:glycosyltransferase family 87 protein [Legionella bozemanae]|uniref:glycosyltransferase family 87 protein n=1 Tax=Legionella bozemanae TaxID=447 RepID=UPI00399CF1E4
MSHCYRNICILVLLSFYCVLSFFIFKHYQRIDFSSFYYSAQALLHDENPYRNFFTAYSPSIKILPANLNPPFAFWLFDFFARLSFSNALIVWFCFSLILGIIGITITFRFAFATQFLQKNYVNLYLLYFAFFPTLMNFVTQQFGCILLFFIMLGYYFYLNHRDYIAGILWGIIIAIKLFPALLLFYTLKQGRKKVFITMIATLLMAVLLPVLFHGPMIYKHYFKMMNHVFWYGDDWNASIYGFIFRLFFGGEKLPNMSYLIPINLLYGVLFIILFLWYWRKLGPTENNPINHQPFCLTLAMMLFMSPFGWMYYFSLLIFPMILTWFAALEEQQSPAKTMFVWLLCLFLVNLPIDYLNSQDMPDLLVRISFFSSFFYGLILLIYLLGKRKKIYGNNEILGDGAKHYSISGIIIIFILGVFVPIIYYLIRLLNLHLNLGLP